MRRVAGGLVLCVWFGLVAGAPAGCARAEDDSPPVATPSVTLTPARIPLGGPVEITYRFEVADPLAPIADDYRVLVHFLDAAGELLWTDDHDPPIPSSRWTAGQTIEYQRTVFVPVIPYLGECAVEVGLYTPGGARLPLEGQDSGQRSYRAATLELLAQAERIFVIFKDGWHSPETAEANVAEQWQWSRGEASVAFRNPRAAALVYLDLDARPDLLSSPPEVRLTIGDQEIDRFSIETPERVLRKIPVTPEQLGEADMVEVRLSVAPTFVPAQIPAAQSGDTRELGVRVFHLAVRPES